MCRWNGPPAWFRKLGSFLAYYMETEVKSPGPKGRASPLAKQSERSLAWYEWQWPDSALFDVAVSLLIGLLYALLLLGPRVLNPTNLAWLQGDPAVHYVGWALFSQTPGWHWPLTLTERIGYPIGDAVANVDLNSVAALALKPFASLLPAKFQYLGPWAILSIALQFYFGVRLIRIFFGRELWPLLCGGLLLSISPVMTWRLRGHFSLANHWLILAALCLYFAIQRGAHFGRKLAVVWCLLTGVAIAINPYLGLCVLGISATVCLRSLLVRQSRWRLILAVGAAAGFSFLLSGYAIGVIRPGGGFTSEGYRSYSMNLLAPIDTQEDARSGALLLNAQPRFPGQYEGYNYLGLGTLALILVLVATMAATKRRPHWPLIEILPLIALCIVFTLLALSTKVTVGSHVLLDLDPRERLTPFLAVFRSSGRLFWVPYYLITAGAVVALFRVFPKPAGAVFGIGIVFLQFADEAPLRASVRRELSPRADVLDVLRSPVWRHLNEKHQNLLVFPPRQCNEQASPGGRDGAAIFGMLAATQHMRTNSYFSSRYSPRSLAWHCQESVRELLSGKLRADSAYVLSPNLASFVAANDLDLNLCHRLDGFILCSKVTDFGLGPGIKPEAAALPGEELSFGASTSSKYLVNGWWWIEPWGVWSNGDGTLWFQVTADQAKRFHNIILNMQILVGKRPVRYSITAGSQEVRGVLAGATSPRTERLSPKLPLQPRGGTNIIRLKVSDPVRPIDAGISGDPRALGAGILSLRLVP
jgi:hypothetical protein